MSPALTNRLKIGKDKIARMKNKLSNALRRTVALRR